MTDIVFLDTKTLGLDPDAPIWEFAAIRRFADGREDRAEFFIRHDPTPWLHEMAEPFLTDYQNRYRPLDALNEHDAAIMVHLVTRGAKIVGCNPGFDLERLDKLLHHYDITPEWNYHPLDITSVAIGYAAARALADGLAPDPPWRSEQMAGAVGVATADFARHTAMGDVQWARAQWDAVMRP